MIIIKKPYTLDFEIKSATDRNALVTSILDSLEQLPSETELEQMADYILFGKDDKFLSAVDRKEIMQPARRFNSWKTKSEKNESLDALMEDPNVAPQIESKAQDKAPRYKVYRPEIRKPKYDAEGNITDPGDSDVPGMVELWAHIDSLQERYDMYRGKIEANEWVRTHPMNGYQLYKLGHMLIDIRRHQYYLKDAYKPAIHFFNVPTPGRIDPNFCENTGLWLDPVEWCGRKRNPKPYDMAQPNLQDAPQDERGRLYWKVSDNAIDYEEPLHVLALIDNYVNLLKHCYDRPDSNTRMLLFDLERLIELSDLTEVEQFVLECRVAHKNVFLIQQILEHEGIQMSELQIRAMERTKIPKKLSTTARRLRLESQMIRGEIPTLVCSKCGRALPKDPFYFARSRDKRTGYCSQCKECQKASRERRQKKPNAEMSKV